LFARSIDPKTGSLTKWRGNYFVFIDSVVAPPIVPMSFPSALGADKTPEQVEDEAAAAAAGASKKRKSPAIYASKKAELGIAQVTKAKPGRPRKIPLRNDGAGASVSLPASVVFAAPAAAAPSDRRPSAARQMQELVERSKASALNNDTIELRNIDDADAYGEVDVDYVEDDGRFGDVVDVVADDVVFNPTTKYLLLERNDGPDGAKRLHPMYTLTNFVYEEEIRPPVALPVRAPVARAFRCNWRSCDLINRLFKYSRMRYGQNAGSRPNEFVVRFDFVFTSALHAVNAIVAVIRKKKVLGRVPPLYTWTECGAECAKMCFDLCLALRARKLGVSSTFNGKSHFSPLMIFFQRPRNLGASITNIRDYEKRLLDILTDHRSRNFL
jgi:hypothetical protein